MLWLYPPRRHLISMRACSTVPYKKKTCTRRMPPARLIPRFGARENFCPGPLRACFRSVPALCSRHLPLRDLLVLLSPPLWCCSVPVFIATTALLRCWQGMEDGGELLSSRSLLSVSAIFSLVACGIYYYVMLYYTITPALRSPFFSCSPTRTRFS